MNIKVHKDKCGYWAEWERENKIVSASLVELVEAYDKKPMRRGRWKGAGMSDYMCSWCGEVVSGNKYTYCPYCGIPMRKDEVEE